MELNEKDLQNIDFKRLAEYAEFLKDDMEDLETLKNMDTDRCDFRIETCFGKVKTYIKDETMKETLKNYLIKQLEEEVENDKKGIEKIIKGEIL